MDSIGLCNSPQRVACGDLIRHSRGPVVLCVMVLWGAAAAAAAAADLTDETSPTTGSQPMAQGLFLPPVLIAADIDPDVPAVYRLPPVAQPVPLDDDWPTDDQPADDRLAAYDIALSVQPEPTQAPSVHWDGLMPSVGDPVPEDLNVNADAPVAGTDAPARRENSYAHHDTDRPDAADNHLSDADAGGGPVVGPAVEAGVLPYTPTTVELTAQLLPAVQHACGLAQRGATFAAQAEFIQVLRRIAQSLDAQSNTDEHARALAAGLRALDEADDFAPRGTQLEAELDVAMMASSHRTPVLAGGTVGVSPREAAALYLSYAQEQLGQAVAGQQAGSMALHAMGRLYSRSAQSGDGDIQSVRRAMTMYLAALEACPQNHLAANELGVLLAHNGHHAEAEAMFRRAVTISPSATGYHNLAVVEQKLGRPQEAIANQQQADRLAAWERANGDVSRRKGIQWVAPDVLARGGSDAVSQGVPDPGRGGGPPGSPAFAPPPLTTDAAYPTTPSVPIQVARPYSTPAQNRMW
jgi:tetratricopeptide (TPR) repeat protein